MLRRESNFLADTVHGTQIRITDPIEGGVGSVYLFRTTRGLAPAVGQQYVNYNFNVAGKLNYYKS